MVAEIHRRGTGPGGSAHHHCRIGRTELSPDRYAAGIVRLPRVNLAEISGGSGRRAVGILVAAHLLPGLGSLALWFFGLLPIFDHARWIPITLAAIYSVGTTLWLFLAFGVWGTTRTYGRSYGEDYEKTFSPRVGLGLGWLRWFLQIVLVFVVFVPAFLTFAGVRWWHLAGTEELDALPDRAATIPVMADWQLVDFEASETGFPEFMESTEEGPEPSGFVEQRYEVADTFTFDDLKQWLEGPEWTAPATGEAFGAIQIERCATDDGYCDVRAVPPEGEQPEYFIRAQFREAEAARGEPEVRVRLTYHRYVPPNWGVSDETVERAREIPVPADWLEIRASADRTRNGEEFNRRYRVPESFEPSDLEAWINGPVWTSPESGEPFGRLDVRYCKEAETVAKPHMCSAVVAGTEHRPWERRSGPTEVILVSLDADQTVWVHFERNG